MIKLHILKSKYNNKEKYYFISESVNLKYIDNNFYDF